MNTSHDFILFDLDGTLSDPLQGIGRSLNYALAHFGYPERELVGDRDVDIDAGQRNGLCCLHWPDRLRTIREVVQAASPHGAAQQMTRRLRKAGFGQYAAGTQDCAPLRQKPGTHGVTH